MIILRHKFFSRVTPFTDKLRKDYEFNRELASSCDKVKIDVQPSNDYIIQYNKSSATNRTKDDKFRNDIQHNPNTWFSDAPNDDPITQTHFLGDESTLSSSIEDRNFIMFSKWINKEDRFNYKIYKPVITINQNTGEKTYYQKIVLATCLYHNNNGSPKAYVKGQEGIGWHKRSKATQKKIKDKKNKLTNP